VRWPGLCCWWCTLQIPSDCAPTPLAVDFVAPDKFELQGYFCTTACCKAYAINRGVSFSLTTMYLRRNGGGGGGGHAIAPDYLTHAKFGPSGRSHRGTPRVRRRTLEIVAGNTCSCNHKSIKRTASDLVSRRRKGPAPRITSYKADPLHRKTKKFCGPGTLVPWLDEG
jgi:hypothetical protein